MQTGQMIFTSTEQVVFGKPAAESVLEIAEAQDASLYVPERKPKPLMGQAWASEGRVEV